MLQAEISSEVNITSADVREAYFRRLRDAGDKGFAVSQERVPEDTGQLAQTGFPPERRGESVVYGYTAPHALPMEKGTGPFYPPVRPLIEWAERIGKSAGFGYWVATQKIPQEGIDAQPYLAPSKEEARRFLNSRGLDRYLG